MIQTVSVRTSRRTELVDITRLVQDALGKIGISEGVCYVYVPHTTAGVTINENADPSVIEDILAHLNRTVPFDGSYRHGEGNSAAHIKATLTGGSQVILVEAGKLVLGTWQGIYFCEFDGPRNRKVHVKVIRSEEWAWISGNGSTRRRLFSGKNLG
jgi:secondary thiamine-phosphate synthase enzyme